VLRPAIVYGPWSSIWTVGPVTTLRDGAVALVGEGRGVANTVYVDNLVAAIALALSDDRAVGATAVVADEDGLTWRGLYDMYAQMLSPRAEVRVLSYADWRRRSRSNRSLRAAARAARSLLRSPEARALLRAAGASPALRRVGSRAVRIVPGGQARLKGLLEPGASVATGPAPQRPVERLPSLELVSVQTSGAVFRSRLLRELGWTPPVPPERAFELTEAWLRFARYL
jgi:nucleoside-diphosphate-sugar epimerase